MSVANFKTKRMRDPDYLKSFKGAMCWHCGLKDDTVVGAHIRWGQEGGTGLKPDDNLTVPLCGRCHAKQESQPGPEFWADMLKRWARWRYEEWIMPEYGSLFPLMAPTTSIRPRSHTKRPIG